MSAHVLLNLLNHLGKRDKMRGLSHTPHRAVKLNFRRYTSTNENFEYNYPLSIWVILPCRSSGSSPAPREHKHHRFYSENWSKDLLGVDINFLSNLSKTENMIII